MRRKASIIIILIAFIMLMDVDPADAINVLSISPTAVTNSISNTITINGADFENGAVVKLNGVISLMTNFIDTNTLTALLPLGFQAGLYDVSVVNPDNTISTLVKALTVEDGITTKTITPTSENTSTPVPAYARPVVVISTYAVDPNPIQAGSKFSLSFTVTNQGQIIANNLMLSFTPDELFPLDNGGVLTVGELKPGASKQLSQLFFGSQSLYGLNFIVLEGKLNYTDVNNNAFDEIFTLTIPLAPVSYINASATPTPTPTVMMNRPRLLVIGTRTDLTILKPGAQFNLQLQIQNVGSEYARNVNMIIGGATLTGIESTDTPNSGSYSASSGDFQYFSPLGSSNIQSLGDLLIGSIFTAVQPLIVNVSTNPGAYPIKISFVYQNSKGETLLDDQVITLLVQSPPLIDISFYRDPDPFFLNQQNTLPLQVINIGKKSSVLGNMVVSVQSGQLENKQIQLGYLDPGGYMTLDAIFTPEATGIQQITVSVEYIDDFNQPQEIIKILEVEVIDAPSMEIPQGIESQEIVQEIPIETIWQKIWRFIRGLLGFDSGLQLASPDMPIVEEPSSVEPAIVVP